MHFCTVATATLGPVYCAHHVHCKRLPLTIAFNWLFIVVLEILTVSWMLASCVNKLVMLPCKLRSYKCKNLTFYSFALSVCTCSYIVFPCLLVCVCARVHAFCKRSWYSVDLAISSNGRGTALPPHFGVRRWTIRLVMLWVSCNGHCKKICWCTSVLTNIWKKNVARMQQ